MLILTGEFHASFKFFSVYKIDRWDLKFSTVLAEPLYCSPAWSEFCSAADSTRIEAFIRRCQRLGYCSSDTPTLSEMFDDADELLFTCILNSKTQVLQSYLSERTRPHNLRTVSRNKELITKTSELNENRLHYTNAVQKLLKLTVLLYLYFVLELRMLIFY